MPSRDRLEVTRCPEGQDLHLIQIPLPGHSDGTKALADHQLCSSALVEMTTRPEFVGCERADSQDLA